MSAMQQGSSDGARGRRAAVAARAERGSRRTWTPHEEAVLLHSLKELVAMGWKSDNGFRGGYLGKLEEAMKAAFPKTDLKGTPHINSKLQNWKRNYYSLSLMLSRSGVGYNADGTHTIDCTADQWDQIVKCDANAKTMRYKSWPLYADWQEIFGKDRANGDAAEDIMDAVNELNRLDTRADDILQDGDDYNPKLDDINMSDEVGEASMNNDKEAVFSKMNSKGKKRGADDSMLLVSEMLGEINRCTNERLDKIASRIGYEFDLDQSKKDAYEQQKTIPGLTRHDKFDICEIFADKTANLLVFNSLPDEVVRRMCSGCSTTRGTSPSVIFHT